MLGKRELGIEVRAGSGEAGRGRWVMEEGHDAQTTNFLEAQESVTTRASRPSAPPPQPPDWQHNIAHVGRHLDAPPMTDATDAAAEPPKKRFGFKKAAWQTAPKTEAHDMFSHADEFSSIVAAEARRKSELKKKKAEEEQRRKLAEEHKPKRRKVSAEEVEIQPGRGLRSSARGDRVANKGYVRCREVVGLRRTDFRLGEAKHHCPPRTTAPPLVPLRHATTLLQSPLAAR